MNRPVLSTTSPDTAYHRTPDCRRLRMGQDLWDTDCPDDYCSHRHSARPVQEKTLAEALGLNQRACTECFPGSQAALATASCEEDFGHQPIDEYAGTEFEGKTSRIVCRRCIHWFPRQGRKGVQLGQYVEWPCTSAIIYGLVLRTEEEVA